MPDDAAAPGRGRPFPTLLVVGQRGRVGFEACLLAATLRQADPGFAAPLVVAEPQPGPLWPSDPRLDAEQRALLLRLGAEIRGFDSDRFGASYPYGNKIEALSVLDPGTPFLFLDSDTAVTGPLSAVAIDPDRPTASLARDDTWPAPDLYGPDREAIWGALHDRFGLDFAASQDPAWPRNHWRRYLYFNAGWFFGPCPRRFGTLFAEMAAAIRDDPPAELICQILDPWLDQIALPLAIHALGGGRGGPHAALDGGVATHYRAFPLLYARGPQAAIATIEAAASPHRVRKVLKRHEPLRRFVYQGRGAKARALFEGAPLPAKEAAIRNRLRRAGLWMR